MLIGALLNVLVAFLGIIFSWVPVVTELPVVDYWFVASVQWYKLFASYFPPMTLMLELFTYYLLFKLTIITLRFFIGHRTPVLS